MKRTDNGPATLDGAATAAPRKTVTTDSTLRYAAKLDRLLAELPEWGQRWAIGYLVAKYLPGAVVVHAVVGTEKPCGS